MSLSSSSSRNDYTGNGSVATYSYNFKIFQKSELVATIADLTTPPIETQLVVDVDYTVSGVGTAAGGSITLIDSGQSWLSGGNLKTGYRLCIRRVRSLTQTTDIRNQGAYYPESIEDTFDKLVMLAQQLQEQANRSVKTAVISDVADTTLPEPVANEVIAWDATGTKLVTVPPPASGANGTNGSTWYTSTGVPGSGLGAVGDFYLNTNGDYYQKTGATTWTLIGNLLGPAGPAGAAGAAGAAGPGVPTGGTAGQVLSKIDGTDFNTQWVNQTGGGSSPTTTKGDMIVHDSSADQRLPVGTNGQVLVADSTQALGVKWAPAPAGSPLTTKGDLYVYDTANDRLPVGTDGQILTADSTQTTGMKWATPASGFANPMTTLGDLMFEDATPTAARLAGNTSATKKYLSQTGTGAVSAAPTWSQPTFSELSGSPSVSQVHTVTGSTGVPQSITAAGGISTTAAIPFQTQFIKGSGGAVSVTANPQIVAGTVVGQMLILIGTDDVNTVTIADGNGLSLNGDMTFLNHSAMTLLWDGTVWSELSRRY